MAMCCKSNISLFDFCCFSSVVLIHFFKLLSFFSLITNIRRRTAAVLKIVKSPYLSEKSCEFDKIRYTTFIDPHGSHETKNWIFFKFKMAAAAMLKIAILAINHQPIVWFQRNFSLGNRTACRQRPGDKNCKFSKSKMVDGGHFENR